MNKWLSLITTLPTENATLRQRAWRALKASGAAVLRDGVYLMPERESCRVTLDGLASEVREGGGGAHVLRVEEPEGANFAALFDRGSDFAALLSRVHEAIQSAGDIQIIVGARADPTLLDVVPCDHVTHAHGERLLF